MRRLIITHITQALLFIVFFVALCLFLTSCEKEESIKPKLIDSIDSIKIQFNANTYDTYEAEITWNDKIRKIQFNEGLSITYLPYHDSVSFNIKVARITTKDPKFSVRMRVKNTGYTVVNSLQYKFKAKDREVFQIK